MRTKLNVIFRTCDVVNAVHGTDRPFGFTKEKLINYCFVSMLRSLKICEQKYDINHDFYIVGDRLHDKRMEWYKAHEPKLIINDEFTNGPSIAKTFELAKDFDDEEWIYFCEDDYLHMDDTIDIIYEFIDNRDMHLLSYKTCDLFIHPVDYPDRYSRTEDLYEKWHIFISKYSHWRQIYNTTYTFLCQVKSFKKYFDIFMESAPNWNDSLFSKNVFRKNDVICLSPMPSLACHMHEVSMSPFIDWLGVVNELRNKESKR